MPIYRGLPRYGPLDPVSDPAHRTSEAARARHVGNGEIEALLSMAIEKTIPSSNLVGAPQRKQECFLRPNFQAPQSKAEPLPRTGMPLLAPNQWNVGFNNDQFGHISKPTLCCQKPKYRPIYLARVEPHIPLARLAGRIGLVLRFSHPMWL